MKKEIKIGFNAQSKAVVEHVEIKWFMENDSENFINKEELIKEVKELHGMAAEYARHETMKRNR